MLGRVINVFYLKVLVGKAIPEPWLMQSLCKAMVPGYIAPPKLKNKMNSLSQPESNQLIADTLLLEFEEQQYLHIGLLPEESDSALSGAKVLAANCNSELPRLQENFSQYLCQKINQAANQGSRILVVGASLKGLPEKLRAQKYLIHWLIEEGSSISFPQLICEFTSGSIIDLALANSDTELFDCVVFAGTFEYLDQLSLLTACRSLLKESGTLLIFGEFLDDDSLIEYSAIPNKSSFVQLSKRLGFLSGSESSLNQSAILSMELFLPLLEKHHSKLVDSNPNRAALIDTVKAMLSNAIAEISARRRCFSVFELIKSTSQLKEHISVEYGDIKSFNPEEIAHLFEKSFDMDFDPELWHWKYALGDGKCVVVRLQAGGEILAHYGGAPRKISYFGKESRAIQPCDVMVSPGIRTQYGKSSLFFKTAATFLEREIGNTVNHLLGFGFPNQKAMNIAIRLGLYEKTDDFIELVYESAATGEQLNTCSERASSTIQDYEIVPLDITNAEHKHRIAQLWESMLEGFSNSIIGLRDTNYLKYRYFDHPFAKSAQYECLLIGNKNESTAIAVLKNHGEEKLLMDIICPMNALKMNITAINQWLINSTEERKLKIWITKAWQGQIQLPGAIVNELGIEIPCNTWNPGPTSQLLYGQWWLTAGDMDFI
jgi:hypothetical protein